MDAEAISKVALLPIKAADTLIVVYLCSIPVIISKMAAEKSLRLR
jgi:hypothetical protein